MNLLLIQQFPFYNLSIGIGIIFAYKNFLNNELKYNIKDDYLHSNKEWIIITLIVFSFIGAAIFENIYHNDFSSIGKFGITFYGGLITAIIVAFLLLKLRWNRFELMFNIATPSILLAHAFGRVGCFLSGCCYGKTFEKFGVFPDVLSNNKIPTQMIESTFLFIGFWVLQNYIGFNKRYLVYTMFYSIIRFLIELLRGDERGNYLFNLLSPSQTISIVLFSLAFWRHQYIRQHNNVDFSTYNLTS